MSDSTKIPHKAVVLIRAEVMEVLPTGQVTNLPLHKEKKVVSIDGDSMEDVKAKLTKFMESIKNV